MRLSYCFTSSIYKATRKETTQPSLRADAANIRRPHYFFHDCIDLNDDSEFYSNK
jgi:hypothetical protein